MAPVIGLVFGALFGVVVAKRKGGNRLDMVQFGASFAIIFCIIGLFIAIFLARDAVS